MVPDPSLVASTTTIQTFSPEESSWTRLATRNPLLSALPGTKALAVAVPVTWMRLPMLTVLLSSSSSPSGISGNPPTDRILTAVDPVADVTISRGALRSASPPEKSTSILTSPPVPSSASSVRLELVPVSSRTPESVRVTSSPVPPPVT